MQWRISDFPEGGGVPTTKLGLFSKFFAENCMKMKEFEPGRGCASLVPPLDPPMKWDRPSLRSTRAIVANNVRNISIIQLLQGFVPNLQL